MTVIWLNRPLIDRQNYCCMTKVTHIFDQNDRLARDPDADKNIFSVPVQVVRILLNGVRELEFN